MSRVLFTVGLLCILLGCIAWLMERAGLTAGRLPGDIVASTGGMRFYFPITTCILLSVFLTVVAYAVRALHK